MTERTINSAWEEFNKMVLARVGDHPEILEVAKLCFFAGALTTVERTVAAAEKVGKDPSSLSIVADMIPLLQEANVFIAGMVDVLNEREAADELG